MMSSNSITAPCRSIACIAGVALQQSLVGYEKHAAFARGSHHAEGCYLIINAEGVPSACPQDIRYLSRMLPLHNIPGGLARCQQAALPFGWS